MREPNGTRRWEWKSTTKIPSERKERLKYRFHHCCSAAFMAFARRIGWLLGREFPKIKIGQEKIDDKLQDKFVTVKELIYATENFSNKRKLGSSGKFFMAKLQGYIVVVKRLDSTHLEKTIEELRSEIGIAGSLQHNNILKLLDVYIEKVHKFLVYEYMKKQSLADISFVKLDWETRVYICLGIAEGLKYLHEHPRGKIILGNIKSANILLNENFEAKISDFGYATLCTEEDKVSVIAREPNEGYMAPEYFQALTRKEYFQALTSKVDVFSFGVVVLEIVSGKKSIYYNSKAERRLLIEKAYKANRNGNLKSLVDKNLSTYNEGEALIILELAMKCTRTDAPDRPTMSEVVSVLVEKDPDKVFPPANLIDDVKVTGSTPGAGMMGWLSEIKIGHEEIDGKLQDKFVTVEELIKATEDFSERKKIGGSRTIFMAKLLGHTVAVKRLDSSHFKEKIDELKKEIHIIKSLQHNNILQLLDVHIKKDLQFLVYEYKENQSLEDILFVPRRMKLNWETRFNICLGIAQGLQYLHEHQIVHTKIKSANILLNENFEAKISNFGFANLYTEEDKVMAIARETKKGYTAPEYLQTDDLNSKVDVFSFGVVVLEIVSGQRNVRNQSKKETDVLLDRAYKANRNGNLMSLVDKNLCTYDEREALIILKLALECTTMGASVRPEMSGVVSVLLGEKSIDEVCPNVKRKKKEKIGQEEVGDEQRNPKDQGRRKNTETKRKKKEKIGDEHPNTVKKLGMFGLSYGFPLGMSSEELPSQEEIGDEQRNPKDQGRRKNTETKRKKKEKIGDEHLDTIKKLGMFGLSYGSPLGMSSEELPISL